MMSRQSGVGKMEATKFCGVVGEMASRQNAMGKVEVYTNDLML
jgi:hypothetical protein